MSKCKHDFDYDGYCYKCRRGFEEIIAELEGRIEAACEAASDTARDWEQRCYSIMTALGEDYGEPANKPSDNFQLDKHIIRAHLKEIYESPSQPAHALRAKRLNQYLEQMLVRGKGDE